MKATDFEYRHPTLVHQFIVAAAFLAYLVQSDDVVWHFVKNNARARELERIAFAVATLFVALGCTICTWALAYRRPEASMALGRHQVRHPRLLGEVFYAMGLGSLAPLWGFVILVAGEVLRVIRLIRRENDYREKFQTNLLPVFGSSWGKTLRQEAVKWGVLFAMIVFVVTLKDRIAEVLLVASLLIGLICNLAVFGRAPDPTGVSSGD